jgi:hypothetical protein
VRVAKRAAKLKALTVELPRGLSVISHRAGTGLTIHGVRVKGGAVRSLALAHGHLVIALKRAVSAVTVTLSGAALKESPALRTQARHHKLKHLALSVIAENAKGGRTTTHVTITHLGL